MSPCVVCGKQVSGEAIRALGQLWHDGCFRCVVCHQHIGEGRFVEQKGRPVHVACFEAIFAPDCGGCGGKIIGRHLKVLGRLWHPSCFVCSVCGQPIPGNYVEAEGKARHVACHHALVSPPCAVCRGPIQTLRFFTNAWGECYCDRHETEYPRCFSCGRITAPALTGSSERLNDGRIVCALCQKDGLVRNLEDARPILDAVMRKMQKIGLDLLGAVWPLRLTSQLELMKLSPRREPGRPPSGLTRTEVLSEGSRVVQRTISEVLILFGLPKEQFAVVATHELCHVWIFLNELEGLPLDVEEGLCSWMEYYWLRDLATPIAQYRLQLLEKDRDPLYGRGYRAAKVALEKMPMDHVIDFLRRHRRFPGDGVLSRFLGIG